MTDELRDVVVVGGGLAGLAATAALAGAGAKVTMLEWRPYLGGRAYSYEHPALHEVIDSQHVLLGCCTNLADLMQRAHAAETIRWYDELTFLEPGGRRTVLRASGLPAPMHQTMSFLRAPMLGLRDKVGIARGLLQFLRGYPADDGESVAAWLRRTGQTERSIRHFWEPVVLGALNDSFELCSTKYAGKVFHESFLRSEVGGRLGIPDRPLSEFFAPVAAEAERHGAELCFGVKAEALHETVGGDGWRVRLQDGREIGARAVVLAGDAQQTAAMCAALGPREGAPRAEAVVRAPITTVHLWMDREVTELEHAALLDTRIQWIFHKSKIRRWAPTKGSYVELTISGSEPELREDRETILRRAVEELQSFFPEVRTATIWKSAVLKEAKATFSVYPGFDRERPTQATPWKGLYVAGDWTQTEWPSTMEGAVRSGRMAAGEVVGDRRRFLVAEEPRSGLMRWLAKADPGSRG